MKTRFLIGVIAVLCTLSSCSKDDSSNYGKVNIHYGDPYENIVWVPEVLYIYSTDNLETPLWEISTKDLKSVKVNLLIGHYVIRNKSGEVSLNFQVFPDRTTRLYYYMDFIIFDNGVYP